MNSKVEYMQNGKPMAIVLLPNGKWMNEYEYFTKEDGTVVCTQSAGQYATFEQAETMMKAHRPHATRIDRNKYLVIDHSDNHERYWFDSVEDTFKWIKELLTNYEVDAAHVYAFKYAFDKYGNPVKKELIF